MRLRCPQCGARMTLAAAEEAEQGAALVEVAAAWGRYLPVVQEYVAAFRTGAGASMSDRKRLRLLLEVREMWEAGRLRYNGKEYIVRPADLLWGLQQVANRELMGLKNHNYLKAVVVGRVRDAGLAVRGLERGQGPEAGGQEKQRKVIEIPDE